MTTRMDSGGARNIPVQTTGASVTGWVIFGAVMLGILGVINVIHGITALQYDELLVSEYVYDNLTFWGWMFLGWGALQVVGSIGALVGSTWGASMGMVLAGISAIMWFFMIFAAPGAALVGIAISMAIIASLATAYSPD